MEAQPRESCKHNKDEGANHADAAQLPQKLYFNLKYETSASDLVNSSQFFPVTQMTDAFAQEAQSFYSSEPGTVESEPQSVPETCESG
jgi:hypothetical protein